MQVTLEQAKEWHAQGKLTEARNAYLAMLAHRPHDVEALHLLGMIYAEEGDFKQAQHYLEKAANLEKDNPGLMLHLANVLKLNGQIEKAIALLLTVTQEHPQFSAAFNNLGTFYFANKNYPAAVQAFQQALDVQPDYIDAYYNLGLALQRQYKTEQAKQAYQAILDLVPHHPGAMFQLGMLLMQEEKYQAAINLFSAILENYPYHTESHVNLATSFLKLGELEKAKQHYLQALNMEANDAQVLFNLGVISVQQEKIDDAINYYDQVTQIDPSHFDAYHNLGFIYLMRKDREAALKYYKAALNLQPQNEAIKHTINIILGKKDLSASPTEYVQALFDSYADHFDTHLLQSLNYRVPALFYQLATCYLPPKTKFTILDLGCGTGLCGELFKPLANKLVGVDISQKMLDEAGKKACYQALYQNEITPFLLEHKKQFDLIIAGDVLVYFGELESVFTAVCDALHDEGYFLFDAEVGEGEDYKITASGRFNHTKAYLDKLIEQTHFTIIHYEIATLRTQETMPVKGHVYLLQKQI